MTTRVDLEKRLIDLHDDRERLLFWLCRAFVHCNQHDVGMAIGKDGGMAPVIAHRELADQLAIVLTDMGYDGSRVERVMDLGEPRGGKSRTLKPSRATLDALRKRIQDVLDAIDQMAGEEV